MIDIHLKRLRKRDFVSAEEERAIRELVSETRDVGADRTIIRSGEPLKDSVFLFEGWMARAKDLPSGQRQFAEIHLPGDFPDLHGFTLKRLEHDLVSLTPCTIGIVPHERLKHVTERMPHLARVFWFATNVDAAIHREWALSLGFRSAIGRMAHLFCELLFRLQVVGRANGNSFEFPLTQVELGQSLGLTSVHVNRTLQELRRLGVIELDNRRLTILDLDRLKEISEFDDSYLYLDKEER